MRFVLTPQKGQSAIEYLMTYGWMLLVVAIVGGAIFAIAGDQSVESSSGFSGGDVVVEEFGITDTKHMQLQLRSATANTAEISEIRLTDSSTGETVIKNYTIGDASIGAGSNKVFQVPKVEQGDGSNSIDVEIIYDTGSLEDLTVSGQISGSLQLVSGGVMKGSPEWSGTYWDASTQNDVSEWAFPPVDGEENDRFIEYTTDSDNFDVLRYNTNETEDRFDLAVLDSTEDLMDGSETIEIVSLARHSVDSGASTNGNEEIWVGTTNGNAEGYASYSSGWDGGRWRLRNYFNYSDYEVNLAEANDEMDEGDGDRWVYHRTRYDFSSDNPEIKSRMWFEDESEDTTEWQLEAELTEDDPQELMYAGFATANEKRSADLRFISAAMGGEEAITSIP